MSFGTIVDSSVLLDLFTDDQLWGDWSAAHLVSAFDAGPVLINPLIYAELSMGFDQIEDLDERSPTASSARTFHGTPASSLLGASCSTDATVAPAAPRCRTSTLPPTRRRPAVHSSPGIGPGTWTSFHRSESSPPADADSMIGIDTGWWRPAPRSSTGPRVAPLTG